MCFVEYFVSMSEALEIPERMETLNRKIDYASEVRLGPVSYPILTHLNYPFQVQVTLRELVTEVPPPPPTPPPSKADLIYLYF